MHLAFTFSLSHSRLIILFRLINMSSNIVMSSSFSCMNLLIVVPHFYSSKAPAYCTLIYVIWTILLWCSKNDFVTHEVYLGMRKVHFLSKLVLTFCSAYRLNFVFLQYCYQPTYFFIIIIL